MPRLAVLAVLALVAVPAAAQGSIRARPKTMLEDHLHHTDGQDWHVQLQVNDKGTRLTSVVLYAETCDESGLAANIPIKPDGSFSVNQRLNDDEGRWSVQGRFVDPDHATGTWQLVKGSCDTGVEDFAAHDGLGHYLVGNPGGYAPRSILGSSYNARHLRNLKHATQANAPRWNTLAKVRRLGYKIATPTTCPAFHHARKNGVSMWGTLLDPNAPQSIVFWCDAAGNTTLAAAMFRAPGESRPPTFGNMIQWHKHGSSATWMTHIWMVPDSVSAFAACAPFPAFAALGMFSYGSYNVDIPIDEPCPDTDTAAAGG